MDFLDDYAVDGDDDDELPATNSQSLASSTPSRSNKRRRLNQSPDLSDDENSPSSPDDYDLPSIEDQLEDDFNNPKSKYDAVMHVPVFAESQKDEFVTQVEQPWSSPSAIRGPRWQKKTSVAPTEPTSPTRRVHNRAVNLVEAPALQKPDPPVSMVIDEFDDDDADLIEALITGGSDKPITNAQIQGNQARQQSKNMRQTTLFGMNTTQTHRAAATQSRTHNWPMASRDEKPTHHKINRAAMQTWTYPLNVGTIRDYQFNIVHRALFHNILVALPTGLGKTFIAATVMLNYFNWTQDSQIVFVAPTKPLVTQQVNACFHIAGIPRSQTTLLTGEIQPAIRAEEWQEKRVFFMTPQTLINDLKTGMADPKKIVLLVVDEAHRATGNYAYVEVVRFLRRFNSSFRVLALTATPGGNVEAVQKVIDGLDIARVEIRTEESMDIRSFVHTRNENFQLFDNSEEIEMCLELLSTALKPVLAKVNSLNAYFSNDPKTMTLYGLVKGREQWAKSEAGRSANWGLKSMVQSCFKPLMTMAHNLELLKFHGIGPFYQNMKVFDEEAGAGKYVRQIVESPSYKTLMTRLKAWVNDDDFEGHPKLTYLSELVLNHFMDAGDGQGAAGGRPPSDTRIMVFAHYRDSAEEIVRILNRHQPMIRAHVFVGQAGTKRSEGMDQKTQIDIIKKFKTGTYNTLVATSIGEEGLDIGEVDLIVCYDCSKSPIRMLQRMGRTGRKRAGNIMLLLMRGKEERDYHAAKDNYLKMQSIIESGKEFQFHEDMSPRIVPRDIQPVVDKRRVEIPLENTQADDTPEPKRRKAKPLKRPPKKFHMPDDVETGFQFLGNRKKAAVQQHVTKKTGPKHDIDEAVLPPLLNVLLREEDEEELERRFAQVAGDEVQYVQGVRLDAFPQIMRKSGKTKSVGHSSTTRRLLKASKAMHVVDQDWTRPPRLDIITAFHPNRSTPGQGVSKPHARDTIEHDRSSSTGDSSTRSTQDEDYDLDDDFVDDRQTSQNLVTSTRESITDEESDEEQLEVQDSARKGPLSLSQKSTQNLDSDPDDMPALDKILVRQTNKSADKPKNRANKTRRIVSDDSDE